MHIQNLTHCRASSSKKHIQEMIDTKLEDKALSKFYSFRSFNS